MLIYEVNLSVEEAVAEAYAAWLREHIRRMLEIDGLERAVWYERDDSDDSEEEHRAWTIHYRVADRAALQAYFDVHAGRMRGEGLERFAGRFEATRRVLERRERFGGEVAGE